MAGEFDLGAIDVSVEPDASRFPEELAAAVSKAERGADPVEVRATLDKQAGKKLQADVKSTLAKLDAEVAVDGTLAKTFARDVQRLAKEALRSADIEVPVDAVLPRGFRNDLQREVKSTLRGAEVEIPVQATVPASFRSKLQRAVREATADSNIEVPIQGKIGPGFKTNLRAAFREATADLGLSIDVRPVVSKVGYAEFVADLRRRLTETAASDVASIEIRSDLIGGFTEELAAKVGAATTAISASEAASVEIRADVGPAAAEVAAIGGAADASSGRMGSFVSGTVIGLASIVGAAGLAGAALYGIGSSFDDALDTIRVASGGNEAVLTALQAGFRETAAVVPSSLDEVSLAVSEVYKRLGLAAGVGNDVAGQFLNLSRITGTDLATNITTASSALQSFSITGQDIPGALDLIYRASQASGVSFDALSSSIGANGAALRTAGFDFGESASLIAQLTKAGVPAEAVIGSLGIAARKLAKDGKEPASAIADLVQQIRDAKNPTEALALAQGVFGRGAVGITDAIRSGKFELDSFTKSVVTGGETISGVSADTADAAESFQLLKNNLALALEVPASEFFGEIGKVVAELSPVLTSLGPVISRILGSLGGVASGFLEALIPIAKELLPALAPIGDAIADTFAVLGPALAPVIGAIGRLLSAFAPLLPILGDAAASILQALVPAFDALADPELVDALVEIAVSLAEMLVAVAPLIPSLVKLAVPVATLVVKLLAFKPLLYGVIAGLVTYQAVTAAATLATTLFTTASEGFALSPIGLAVAAVVALGVGVFVAYKKIKPFRDLVDSVGRFFRDDFAPAVVSVAKAVGGFLVDAFAKARDLFDAAYPTLRRLFDIFVGIQLGPILNLGKALAALFSGDFSGFADRLGDAFLSIPRALGDLVQLLGPALATVGQWLITTGLPLLGSYAVKLGGALVGWVADVAPEVIAFLGQALLSIGEWIVTTAIPGLAEAALGLAVSFLSWAGQLLLDLPPKLAEIGLSILGWVGQLVLDLALAAGGLVESFLGWIVETSVSMPGRLLELALTILLWVATTAADLAPKALALATSFLGWIVDTGKRLPGMLAELALTILNWIGDQERKLAEKAVALATAFLSWVVETAKELPGKLAEIASDIETFLRELPGKLVSLVKELVPKLARVGIDLVEGIFSGLAKVGSIGLEFAKKAVNAIIDFINDRIIDAINRSLEIEIKVAGVGVTIDPPDIPRIPHLAEGGFVDSPTVALIGEAGRELVLPLTDEARSLQLLAEAGVGDWTIPDEWRDPPLPPTIVPSRSDLAAMSAPSAPSRSGSVSSDRWIIEEGGVVFQVTPPSAEDPANYAQALEHRFLPLLARVLGRVG